MFIMYSGHCLSILSLLSSSLPVPFQDAGLLVLFCDPVSFTQGNLCEHRSLVGLLVDTLNARDCSLIEPERLCTNDIGFPEPPLIVCLLVDGPVLVQMQYSHVVIVST